MKTKGFTAKNYLIGMMLFSAITLLGYLMLASLATDYGNPDVMDKTFTEKYNKLTNQTETVSSMLSTVQSSEGITLYDAYKNAEAFVSATFSVVNLIFESIKLTAVQTLSIGEDFNIPSAVSGVLISVFLAIITITIIFIAINVWNKTEKL